MQLITNSRAETFKTCRKRHQYAYEFAIRPVMDGKALRMGTVWHASQEQLSNTGEVSAGVDAIRAAYRNCPETIEPYDWRIEEETLIRLLCGYAWRWSEDVLTHVAVEESFELPLTNPETGAASRIFNLAGKIDGIIQLEDGRGAVLERKLLGDNIGPDSDLWHRLRFDSQISLYVIAARELRHDVATVLYDVCRKPTIKPKEVPYLDKEGRKIVLDRNGIRQFRKNGEPIISSNTEKGWILQTHMMTVEEWGEALNGDIASRPDYYYTRTEVPRLDNELDECRAELWDLQQTLRDAQRGNRWYRTCNRNTCPFCPYAGPCLSGFDPRSDPLPEGFEFVTNIHPELGEPLDANNIPTTNESTATATAEASAD